MTIFIANSVIDYDNEIRIRHYNTNRTLAYSNFSFLIHFDYYRLKYISIIGT